MDNLRGIILMIAAMAGFAVADMFIKLLSARLPTGEIILLMGLGGLLIFGSAAMLKGDKILDRDFFAPIVLIKNVGEIIATFGVFTALALTPISSASAIFQTTPLVVTLGAAVFMREAVGWRRLLAIAGGFGGVMLVIRPGADGFEPASLFAVLAVVGMSMRDLAIRAAPKNISSLRLSTYGFLTITLSGLALVVFKGPFIPPVRSEFIPILMTMILGAVAYYALTGAMRAGDVSVITPFRYSRILFAIMIGIAIFGERPDFWMITGAFIIVASGIYTVWRENRPSAAVAASSHPRDRTLRTGAEQP